MLSLVDFRTLDVINDYLVTEAEKLADFLVNNKSMLSIYCTLMRTNVRWKRDNFMNHYNKWKSVMLGKSKNPAADKKQLAALVLSLYRACKNNADISRVRGLVPEKILEKLFNKRHQDKTCKLYFGAQVIVQGVPVEYVCLEPYDNGFEDSDKSKKTVDVGFWDGSIGEFSEIKFSPEGFHTKDIKYLNTLASCLDNCSLCYRLYLIALDEKELIRSKLLRLNLWDDKFTLIGKEEIYSLQNAS